jgi:hypothetical protein
MCGVNQVVLVIGLQLADLWDVSPASRSGVSGQMGRGLEVRWMHLEVDAFVGYRMYMRYPWTPPGHELKAMVPR